MHSVKIRDSRGLTEALVVTEVVARRAGGRLLGEDGVRLQTAQQQEPEGHRAARGHGSDLKLFTLCALTFVIDFINYKVANALPYKPLVIRI